MSRMLKTSLFAPLLLVLAGASAQAQPIYRIVGPDGKVTFSDRAPDSKAQPAQIGSEAAATGAAALPYELQQVAARFPVTLYTGSDCIPCTSARNLLVVRGIPFTERTVTSPEDIDALQRLSNSSNLPFGTIGNQHLVGFSDVEWKQYLDAAGYPKQSQLPANYRRPEATPLVAIKPGAPAKAPQTAAPAAPRDGRTTGNPAGIRF